MPSSKIEITVPDQNFDTLAASSDDVIAAHFQAFVGRSRKRVIPRSVHYNARRISRSSGRLTVHLLDCQPPKDPIEVARFCFVPFPRIV